MNDGSIIVDLIQLMLAPGIMINACGLLLLGINNRYSIVVSRIRLLNQECRTLRKSKGNNKNESYEFERLENVSKQIELLYHRLLLIRNTVISYAIAIALFVITSLLIGFAYFYNEDFNIFIIITFLAGIVAVLLGAIFTGIEIIKGYRIVGLEINADE